jgi:hypothetical protein
VCREGAVDERARRPVDRDFVLGDVVRQEDGVQAAPAEAGDADLFERGRSAQGGEEG